MKKELLEIEEEIFGKEIPLLDYIYIIQTRRKHDSGYMCMEIIGENKEGYKKKLATYSDVIDLENVISNKEFVLSIDIPEYGVMRLFSHIGRFKIIYYGISSFDFEIIERDEQK